MKILIMGLPGAGKTTLASSLREVLWADGKTVAWFNADDVRAKHDDWDFTPEGRARQNDRMIKLAEEYHSKCKYVICDFVAPLSKLREDFNADFIIWVDTINTSIFEDTNSIFEQPENYNIRVTEKDSKRWATVIAGIINPKEKL